MDAKRGYQGVGRDVDRDSRLVQAVRAELRVSLDATSRRFVGVTVEDAVVRLTGFIDSYAEKWAVERAAARVAGVRGVRNYVVVLPTQDPFGEDFRIRRAAQHALEWDARVPDGVRGEVTDGVLRLRGVVERFQEREAAEEAVRNLVGVRDVVNEIRVAPAPSAADLEADIEAAIRRRFGTGGHRVVFVTAEGVVTLSGVVPTLTMLEDLERTVRSLPGVTRLVNELLVA
jgi:osmotically-inducible protein OsmY